MTPEQLQIFLEDNRKSTAEAIELTVNGKINKLQANVNRMLPVVEAYEASQRALNDAKATGKFTLVVASFITAVGGAYLILRQIFWN